MKIYLAGKISHTDWRHGIVGGNLRGADGNGDWHAERIRFWGTQIYTGPFFVGCDHGCSHTFGEHGMLNEMCVPQWASGPDPLADALEQDGPEGAPEFRKYRGPGPDITNSATELVDLRRSYLINKCRAAIDDSDMVFAWLDDPTAHGTIWELGYAAGKGIQTAVGFNGTQDMSDLWFPIYGAGQVYRASSPREALTRSIGGADRKLAFMKCESPIETKLLTELYQLKTSDVGIEVQYEIGRYRLDFALFCGTKRVDVECDGHDFHERTKEQARRDRSRDRALQAAGWIVCRFTGSEIHRDAAACAVEALRFLQPEAAE